MATRPPTSAALGIDYLELVNQVRGLSYRVQRDAGMFYVLLDGKHEASGPNLHEAAQRAVKIAEENGDPREQGAPEGYERRH